MRLIPKIIGKGRREICKNYGVKDVFDDPDVWEFGRALYGLKSNKPATVETLSEFISKKPTISGSFDEGGNIIYRSKASEVVEIVEEGSDDEAEAEAEFVEEVSEAVIEVGGRYYDDEQPNYMDIFVPRSAPDRCTNEHVNALLGVMGPMTPNLPPFFKVLLDREDLVMRKGLFCDDEYIISLKGQDEMWVAYALKYIFVGPSDKDKPIRSFDRYSENVQEFRLPDCDRLCELREIPPKLFKHMLLKDDVIDWPSCVMSGRQVTDYASFLYFAFCVLVKIRFHTKSNISVWKNCGGKS